MLHTPVPEQAPPQPVKVEPAVGAAVRETATPVLNGAEHAKSGQLIPPKLSVTVPEPFPDKLTLSTGNEWVVFSSTLMV